MENRLEEKIENIEPEDDTSVKKDEKKGITKRPLEDDRDIPQLPQELRNMFKPLKCELCDVTVTSPVVAYTHYEGKTHLKNVNAYMKRHYNVESALKKKKVVFDSLKCEVCDLELSSDIVYQQHIAGKQHQKNLRRSKVVFPITKVEVDPTGRFGIGKSFFNETDQSFQPVEVMSPLTCELCNVFTNTEQQMVIHKQGQKHTKNLAKLKSKKDDANVNSTKDSKDHYNEADVWQASPSEKHDSP